MCYVQVYLILLLATEEELCTLKDVFSVSCKWVHIWMQPAQKYFF